jgi:hypothetical protein
VPLLVKERNSLALDPPRRSRVAVATLISSRYVDSNVAASSFLATPSLARAQCAGSEHTLYPRNTVRSDLGASDDQPLLIPLIAEVSITSVA